MNKRNTLSVLAAGALYTAAISTYLSLPTRASAQSPPQGPPAATANAHSVPVDALTGVLMGIINPEVAAENARLARDPNHRAVIAAVPLVFQPFISNTVFTDKPNEFYADVPYVITYRVTNISTKIFGTWVHFPDASIAQNIDLRASCEGWFTGSGALTYGTFIGPATLEGGQSAEVAALLQQVIPNYIDTDIGPKIAAFPAGSTTVSSGAACRSLGVFPSATIFIANPGAPPSNTPPNAILYDPPTFHVPVTVLNSVTVRVTKVRRLVLHGLGGEPEYNIVEAPVLDFFAGFTHTRIQLPPMTEGQVVAPTDANVVTTQIPLQSGLLVLIGDMTIADVPGEDSAFVTFGLNSDFGDGTQTFRISKQWAEGIGPGNKPIMASGPAYEITVEITAPPTQTIAAH